MSRLSKENLYYSDAQSRYAAQNISFPKMDRTVSASGRYCYDQNQGCFLNPSAEERGSGQAVIMCAGDLMCEPKMSACVNFNGKYLFEQCFFPVRRVLSSADFAIGNLDHGGCRRALCPRTASL